MIALVDYGAGNQTSVRKALLAAGAEVFTPSSPPALQFATAIVIPGVGHFAATASLDARWRDAIAGAIDAGTPLLGICLGMQWLFDGSDEDPGLPGLGYFSGRVTRLTSWGSASLDSARDESADPESRPAEAGRHVESPVVGSGFPRQCSGRVSRTLDAGSSRIKIPHVGWNVVELPSRPAEAGRHVEPEQRPAEAGRHGEEESPVVGSGFPRQCSGRVSRTLPPAFEALRGRFAYFTHTFAAPITDDCAGITTHGAPFAAAVARGNVWGVQFHPEKSGKTGLALLRAFVELWT